MAKKRKPYHTLIIRYADKWHIEFGDYDKELVQSELDCWINIPKNRKRIITTNEDQASIEKAVADINAAEKD